MVPGQIPMQSATGQNMKAQAIGQAGQVINQTGNLLLELKAEQERQSFSDAELILRRKSKELAGKLATNLNPEKHLEEAQAFYNSVTEEILSKGGYSPRFEKEMTKRIGMFTESKMAEIATDAKLMQLESGRRKHDALVKSYIEDKKFDEASVLLDEGNGIYRGQDDTDIAKMGVERMRRQDEFDVKEMEGDYRFFEDESLDMADSDRKVRIARAKNQSARMESDQADEISRSMLAGEIKTKDDLARSLEGAEHISDKTAKIMLKNWDEQKPITREDRFDFSEKVRKLEVASTEMNAEEYTSQFLELRTEAAALGRRGNADYIRGMVESIAPENLQANRAKGERLLQSLEKATVDERMKVSMAYWDDHAAVAFKEIAEATEAPFPEKSAALLFDNIMRSWYKKNPGVSREDAERKAFEVQEEIYIDYVKDGFIGSSPLVKPAETPEAPVDPGVAGGTLLPSMEPDYGDLPTLD